MIERVTVDPRIKVREPGELLLLPRVLRVKSIDEDSVKAFSKELSLAHQSRQPIIPIVIDSYGGDVYALLSMIDILKSAHLPIATIVEGKAMSCGAILFTCGTEGHRYIGPNATLMLHDVSATDVPSEKIEEMKASTKEMDRLNRKLWRMVAKNIGKPLKEVVEIVQGKGRADWYLTPAEALRLNIANRIGIPTLHTQVVVEMSLDASQES